jgi:AcrR family transcriptional regulator
MLNMSSAAPDPTAAPAPSGADRAATSAATATATADADLTGRARIRDAAIARFATDGVARTTVRAIAADAGVSPALVIHHYGSKDALRVACDQHVAALVREGKTAAVAAGAQLDPLAALRQAGEGPPVLRYLATTLVDGSPHVAELVDELVADAEAYMEQGVANGMLRPSDDPRGRATVLTLWSLGALVLHDHAGRLLGIELTEDPSQALAYVLPAAEILGRGVLDPTYYDRLREGLRHAQEGET